MEKGWEIKRGREYCGEAVVDAVCLVIKLQVMLSCEIWSKVERGYRNFIVKGCQELLGATCGPKWVIV